MTSIKGHFDGKAIVLDEPADLSVGQIVQVLVDSGSPNERLSPSRPSRFGFAKGMFVMRDDFNEPLDDFADYR